MLLETVVSLLFLANSCLGDTSGLEVKTSFGVVKGQLLLSENGREYSSFTGIPYAQPPVGSLRFKSPQPPLSWEGVLDGTKPSPLCPQLWMIGKDISGQEDCLYLAINTPNVSSSLPVLVYIHGGAFSGGPSNSGSGTMEMGAKFMDEDVVLVGFHYRLGTLGFLSMESKELPGNYGLKDMLAALQWIKKEIHNFGGNPELMTAFGVSAGGASTHYMCSIPQTRKLLKGCISQSGVAGCSWSLKNKGEAKQEALKVLSAINCSEEGLLSCLQAKPLQQILIPQNGLGDLPFVPSIEPEYDGALLTSWPPKDTDFPWITGHTANEGIMISAYIEYVIGPSGLDPYLKNWETYFVQAYKLQGDVKAKAKKIHDRYFLQKDPYKGVEQLTTEYAFAYPALKAASLHKGPKYFYVFNYTGGPSSWEVSLHTKLNITGVGHADDEIYFFSNKNGYKPEGWPGAKDKLFIQTLIKFWVQFAKTQNPNWNVTLPWNEFSNGQYLHLGNEISMKDYRTNQEIVAFWDEILNVGNNANSCQISIKLLLLFIFWMIFKYN